MISKSVSVNLLFILFLASACDSGPKVIPVAEDSNASEQSTGVFSQEKNGHEGHNHDGPGVPNTKDVHTVVVREVLPTEKYVYLLVEEEGAEFWIATSKLDVNVGESYFYRNGLLKTNFHSKEYDRTFDKMYLVSQIVPTDHGSGRSSQSTGDSDNHEELDGKISEGPKDIVVEGSVRIAELVEDPKKYEGQEIQLSGIVTKVNPNIMSRNWLHLKDGSKDDYDLVLTSEHAIPEGHTVTMKGRVSLNKDFGAGYQYAIIVEDGHLVR